MEQVELIQRTKGSFKWNSKSIYGEIWEHITSVKQEEKDIQNKSKEYNWVFL